MSYSWGVGFTSTRTEGIPVVRTPTDASPVDVRSRRSRVVSPEGTDMHQRAAELAPMVDVWRRLLDEHVSDRAGRCRTCTMGGTGQPAVSWPCTLHGVADLARHRHDTAVLARDRMSNERVS